MRTSRLLAVPVLLLMASSIAPPGALCDCCGEPPAPRATELSSDWVVSSGSVRRESETIVLNGNLSVSGGASLELHNVTLLINCSYNGQFGVVVSGASALILSGGSSLSGGPSGFNTTVSVLQGSVICVNDSSLSRLGYSGPGAGERRYGLTLNQSRAELNRAELRDCYAVLDGAGSIVEASQSRVSDFRFGLELSGSSAHLRGSSIEGGAGSVFELQLLNSNVELLNSTYSPDLARFLDGTSSLNVSWSVDVRTMHYNGTPAEGANVTIQDALGVEVLRAATGPGGWLRTALREYGAGLGGRVFSSPYNFSAEWRGVSRSRVGPLDVYRAMEIYIGIDTTPPSVVFTFPASGYVNTTRVEFHGTASDNDAVELVELSRDGGSSWVPASDTGGPAPWSSWSCALELGVGNWVVDARVRDRAGLENRTRASVTVDLTPPPLNISSPPGGLLTNNSVLQLEGSSEPGAMVFVGDDPVPLPLGPDGSFSAIVQLKEGENRIIVRARDPAGNEVKSSVTVLLDTGAPLLNAWASSPLTNLSSVVVFGETEPGAIVTVGGEAVAVSPLGTFSLRVNLTPGLNRIPVESRDAAGNSNLAPVEVFLDTAPPTVSIASPEEGAVVRETELEVRGSARDESGIAAVEVGLDGGGFALANGTTSWSLSVRVEEGNHTIHVRAYDKAGNTREVRRELVCSPIRPDRTPPVVSLKSPLSARVRESHVRLSGLSSDPSGVASVEVSLDGVSWTLCTLSPSGEEWWADVTLRAGSNDVMVRATDRIGNSGTRVFSLVYEPPGGSPGPNYALLAIAGALVAALVALGGYVVASWRRWTERPEPGLGEEEAPITLPERGLK
ncbi:MAG: Ig-like domain-containing protein [Thermoplasmatota archaeon]